MVENVLTCQTTCCGNFEDGTKHKGDLMDILRRDGFDDPVFSEEKRSRFITAIGGHFAVGNV